MGRIDAKVAVTDIVDDEGRELAAQIEKDGGTAVYRHLDTASEENVVDVFAEVHQRFGGLDILVDDAGIAGPNTPTHQIQAADWDKVIAVNVKGVYLCTKQAVPCMQRAQGGSIISLSSIYGLVGAPDLPPYHASKGAVRLMTKTDARCSMPGIASASTRFIQGSSGHPWWRTWPLRPGRARKISAAASLPGIPSGTWANPTTWPAASSTWPRRKRNSSPAASWSSTAATRRNSRRRTADRGGRRA